MKNRHGICGYQAQRAFYLQLRRSRFVANALAY
jgi:hypothetical protein